MPERPHLADTPATVHAQFLAAVARFPAQPFLLVPASATKAYAEGDLAYSYAEAHAEVERLRRAYAGRGLRPGDRVALLLENRPACFFHWLALNSLGISVVPLNPDYRQAELAYVLGHSEAKCAVAVAERTADLLQAARSRDLRISVHAEGELRDAWPTGEPMRALGTEAQSRAAECAVLYTSGTTGAPKGCILSNDYFLRSGLRYMNRRGPVELEIGASRILTPLPMFHMNAMAGSTMGAIFCGGCVIQLDRFHPSSWWHDVARTGATGVHCLGVMPALLLKLPPCADERSHNVRYGTAANIEPSHHAAFESRFGFPLIEGWSMTETGAGAAISADAEPRHVGQRCFGRPPPNLELRLVDEAGQEVVDGEPGEMWVRAAGPDPRRGFFSGYLKDAAATDAAWSGGWWHTGDVARRGPDGSLFFVDRRKNVIRRSGENISALEVEVTLREHPAVHAAAVTAAADEVRGDEVFAFIQLAENQEPASALAESIATWVMHQLAYYKAPGWLAFVQALPTTATQKIERGQLRRLAAQQIAAGTAFDLRALKGRSRRAAA